MGREGFAFQAAPSKLLPPGRNFGVSNPSFDSSGVWFKIKKVFVGTRTCISIVGREGFEPSKAEPSDLQSDVIDHYTTSPENSCL